MTDIYLIYGILYDDDGTTPLASVTVRGRNERTGNKITTTTDVNGVYILDFGNITGGWKDGDQLTAYVIYSDYEDSETITIDIATAYFTEKNLTLVAIADSTTIDYCTAQDVYDELDAKTSSDISVNRIIKAIQRAEGLIDLKTGTAFKSITVADEVHTGDRYSLDTSPDQLDMFGGVNIRRDNTFNHFSNRVRTNFHPIVSVTSLSVNSSGFASADSWTALTQQTGSGGDYYLEDAEAGVIDFLNNYPIIGKRSWKVSYTYGYDRDSTDRRVIAMLKVVERLTILLACKSIITTKSTGAIFDTTRDIKIGAIELRGGAQSSSQYLASVEPEIQELWREIGELGIEVI